MKCKILRMYITSQPYGDDNDDDCTPHATNAFAHQQLSDQDKQICIDCWEMSASCSHPLLLVVAAAVAIVVGMCIFLG